MEKEYELLSKINEEQKEQINKLEKELYESKEIINKLNSRIKELESKLKIKENNTIYSNNYNLTLLKEQIKQKDEEINRLKNICNENRKFVSLDQMTCIYFTSTDQKVHLPIPCIKTDIFAEVEEKLYKEFPEYRETNNTFIVNGRQILRFKTVEENKIKNNTPVLLVVPT